MSGIPYKLSAISPKTHPKYSPNLFRYLTKLNKTRSLDRIGVFHATKWQNGFPEDYLGYFDDNWFIGTRLINVLCNGGRAQSGAYAHIKQMGLAPENEITEFWESYQEIGRCHTDPDHHGGDRDERYSYGNTGEFRTCNWCGVRHALKVTWTMEKRESWLEL